MNEEQKEAEEKRPDSSTDGKSSQQKAVYLIGAIILAILIALGIWKFSKSGQKESPRPTPTTEASSSPEVSSSPSPTPSSSTKVSPKPSPKVSPSPTPTTTPSPTPVAFMVTGVSASVLPTNYSGACAKKFEFSANITTNAAGTVTYKWARNDGAGAPTESITFGSAGTQTVSDSWTLGGSGFTYSGWEKVQILTPNNTESNQAGFSLNCS